MSNEIAIVNIYVLKRAEKAALVAKVDDLPEGWEEMSHEDIDEEVDSDSKVWLPYSQMLDAIPFDEDAEQAMTSDSAYGVGEGHAYEVEIPEWLAINKGLTE